MGKEIKVSIICNTYNHGPYIRDCLESFVVQKTNFAFEVLVHDDASTDNTADIIREYENKYPELIKPIYQKENQYSQGRTPTINFQQPRALGEYIAFCEGDDYWIDPYKLQKQFDVMEAHPELDICTHKVKIISADADSEIGYVSPTNEDKIFSTEEVIIGGGGFVGTNSIFYRANILKKMPEFVKFLPLDYTMQIHGALRGGMLYLSECMAVYRCNVPGSWTQRYANNNRYLKHLDKVKKMLEILNSETEFKYQNAVQRQFLVVELEILKIEEKYRDMLHPKFKEIIKSYSFKERLKLKIKARFPWVLKLRGGLNGRHKKTQ